MFLRKSPDTNLEIAIAFFVPYNEKSFNLQNQICGKSMQGIRLGF